MSCLVKHAILLLIGCIGISAATFSQNKVSPSGGLTVVGQTITSDPTHLHYIGEIKGYSYIKITIEPVQHKEKVDDSTLIEYTGTYYEAVTGKNYTIKVTFEPESQSWNIKCFNRHSQYVSSFNGRETSEGVIEGTWRNKHKSLPFYLFKKLLKS